MKQFGLPILAMLFVFVLALLLSSRRLMSYDEMATYEPAHLPTISQTLSFYTKGLDTPSPIPAVLLHLSMQVIGDGELRNRLVFILFFLGTCALMYAFTAKRYTSAYSTIAILFPASLWGFVYATEMRAYVFVLFFASLMLVTWQRIEHSRFRLLARVGLWLAFAGAVLSHVFAIFLFIPFAFGEASRSFARKRIDKATWAVLFTAPFSLVLLFGAIQLAHQHYGTDFWSKPQIHQIGEAYDLLLGASGKLVIALAIFILFLLLRLGRSSSVARTQSSHCGFTLPEWTLIAGLLAYPIYAFLGSLALGVFVFRYAIPVILGLDLAFVGFVAWGAYSSRNVAVCVLSLITLLAIDKQNGPLGRALHLFRPSLVQQYRAQPWIAYACSSDLPVLTGSNTFLVWQHYAPSCLKSRLYYSNDPQETQLKTGEQNMTLFSRMAPLKVVAFQEFAKEHKRFIVLNTPWFARYVDAPQSDPSFKIASQAKYDSSYNDENGVSLNSLNFETVERN